MNHDQINYSYKKALLEANSFNEALVQWIEIKKITDIEFNQTKLGYLLGFTSKSTISDIIKQRRVFPSKKIAKLCEIFAMDKNAEEYLLLLNQISEEKNTIKAE